MVYTPGGNPVQQSDDYCAQHCARYHDAEHWVKHFEEMGYSLVRTDDLNDLPRYNDRKRIADLTAERDACVNLENICNGQLETVMGERDALRERVTRYEAFVEAWDAFEENPTILNQVRLEQVRAAIDAQEGQG